MQTCKSFISSIWCFSSVSLSHLSLWAMLQWAEDSSFARAIPLCINLVVVVIIYFFFTTEDFSSLERNCSETIWRLRPTKLNRKEKHRISPLYLICCLMPLNYVVHIHCSLSLLQCSPAKPLTVLSECQALQLYDLAFQCANIMLKTSIQLSQK